MGCAADQARQNQSAPTGTRQRQHAGGIARAAVTQVEQKDRAGQKLHDQGIDQPATRLQAQADQHGQQSGQRPSHGRALRLERHRRDQIKEPQTQRIEKGPQVGIPAVGILLVLLRHAQR